MKEASIGIFDSGLGGLSVWREVRQLLPKESLIYYADSANCPYGPRSKEEIIELCEHIVDIFLQRSCKLILIACNTATASAIQYLREQYEVPFVGMEPAIKPAAKQTISQKIGVLATEGTFQGQHFLQTKARYAKGLEVMVQVGEGLVEAVEQAQIDSPKTRQLLHHYIDPMLAKGVDQLVLGCTHYPFLIPVINSIVGNRMTVIDPAPAVARQVKAKLKELQLLATGAYQPKYICMSSGNLSGLQQMMMHILPTSHVPDILFRQM